VTLLGLPHVYLGYWVQESRKMAYKSKFRPSEILRNGQWRPLEEMLSGKESLNTQAEPLSV
jgi:arginine-tRNA-protein transferase